MFGKAKEDKLKVDDFIGKMDGGKVLYLFEENGVNRTMTIYLYKLTPEQREKLESAEAILFEIADHVDEKTEKKLKG